MVRNRVIAWVWDWVTVQVIGQVTVQVGVQVRLWVIMWVCVGVIAWVMSRVLLWVMVVGHGLGQFQISVVPRAVRLAWFSWPGSRAVMGRVAAVGLGVHAPRGGFRARGWRCRKSTHLGTHTIKLGLEFELQRTVHRS